MTWGDLGDDEEGDMRSLRKAVEDVLSHTQELAGKTVEGKGNVNRHLLDGIRDLERVRDHIVGRVADGRVKVRAAAVRCVAQVSIRRAELLIQCSEAHEGYKQLEALCRCLAMQFNGDGTGVAVAPDDMLMAEKDTRKAAGKPDFGGLEYTATSDLSNVDLLMKAVNVMGVCWARWGDAQNALACFHTSEALYAHFRTRCPAYDVRGARGRGGYAGGNAPTSPLTPGLDRAHSVEGVVDDYRERAGRLQALEAEEKAHQAAQMAAKLAEKRRRLAAKTGAPAAAAAPALPGIASPAAAASSAPASAAPAAAAPAVVFPSACTWVDELKAGVEERYTDVCVGLAQQFKVEGKALVSCYYCHKALQRQVGSTEEHGRVGTMSRIDWADNTLGLADFYILMNDLSHAGHCLDAVGILLGEDATGAVDTVLAQVEKADPCAVDALHDLRRLLTFYRARYGQRLVSLLVDVALQPTLSGSADLAKAKTAKLHHNPLAPFPPEEAALLAHSKDMLAKSEERLAFSLPIAPPEDGMEATLPAILRAYRAAEKHFEASKAVYTIEEDCEKFCLVRLEYQTLLGVYQRVATPSQDPRTWLETACLRIALCRDLLEAGLDELVFRNVLRQAHFSLACSYQEIADVVAGQGADAGGCYLEKHGHATDVATYLEAASKHFTAFSERFLKEHKEIQKVTTDPKQKSAFLRLEGSDAPAFVVGEVRHAQVLARSTPPRPKEVLAKYKVWGHVRVEVREGVARFIETNPKSVAEYPELKAHLVQVKQMVKLLQEGKAKDKHVDAKGIGVRAKGGA